MDRRIQKTRQAIMTSFVELLTEQGFDKVTINAIAERANINRGTVYLHFVDKFDLLDKCIRAYIEPLLDYCANSEDRSSNTATVRIMFEYLEKNLTTFKLFLRSETAGFLHHCVYSTIAQALDIGALVPGSDSASNAVAIHFFTSGFMGVLAWWIDNSMPCNVQEVTDQMMLLMDPYAKRTPP